MTPATASDLWALVLAGGDGLRLQAFTRALTGAPIPKQYCRVAGSRSLLEVTLARIEPLAPPARTLTIVNRDHLPLAADQLRSLPAANVLVQPRNLDTGPGLLFSLLQLRRRNPHARVAVFPSDHYIRDDCTFRAHVVQGLELVQRFPEKIVLLGMTPDRPEAGLGYLELGSPLADAGGVFRVAAFVEKPSAERAERIILRGGLWNSFVMLFRLETMVSLLRERRPVDYEALRGLDDAAYDSLTPWNFSRDFLADIQDALVVLQVDDVGWSDLGTREAIERTFSSLKTLPPWHVPSGSGPDLGLQQAGLEVLATSSGTVKSMVALLHEAAEAVSSRSSLAPDRVWSTHPGRGPSTS